MFHKMLQEQCSSGRGPADGRRDSQRDSGAPTRGRWSHVATTAGTIRRNPKVETAIVKRSNPSPASREPVFVVPSRTSAPELRVLGRQQLGDALDTGARRARASPARGRSRR